MVENVLLYLVTVTGNAPVRIFLVFLQLPLTPLTCMKTTRKYWRFPHAPPALTIPDFFFKIKKTHPRGLDGARPSYSTTRRPGERLFQNVGGGHICRHTPTL